MALERPLWLALRAWPAGALSWGSLEPQALSCPESPTATAWKTASLPQPTWGSHHPSGPPSRRQPQPWATGHHCLASSPPSHWCAHSATPTCSDCPLTPPRPAGLSATSTPLSLALSSSDSTIPELLGLPESFQHTSIQPTPTVLEFTGWGLHGSSEPGRGHNIVSVPGPLAEYWACLHRVRVRLLQAD